MIGRYFEQCNKLSLPRATSSSLATVRSACCLYLAPWTLIGWLDMCVREAPPILLFTTNNLPPNSGLCAKQRRPRQTNGWKKCSLSADVKPKQLLCLLDMLVNSGPLRRQMASSAFLITFLWRIFFMLI